MKPKVKQEGDIEKIDKLTGYQLPHKFKIIGLIVFIASILSIIGFLSFFGNSKWRVLLLVYSSLYAFFSWRKVRI